MVNLTEEQKQFLEHHGIEEDSVFDATGLSQSEYRSLMKPLGLSVAVNTTPCARAGHTLRTRSGHCIQCNPAHLEFQIRNDKPGIIYIAGSKGGQLIKVGYSKALTVRDESLNRTQYGGYSDWKILYAINSARAGEIEHKVQSMLRPYTFATTYNHDGNFHDATEMFKCSFDKAFSVLQSVCADYEYNYRDVIKRTTTGYNFRNLRRK